MDKRTEFFIKKIIMENWFTIDYTLFGDEARKVINKDLYENYLTSKAALLDNVVDLYKCLGYAPENFPYQNLSEMFDHIGTKVDFAKDDLEEMLENDQTFQNMKRDLLENEDVDKNQLAFKFDKKFKSALIDSILLKDAIKNSTIDLNENFDFEVLINSHRVIRDSLVDNSMKLKHLSTKS